MTPVRSPGSRSSYWLRLPAQRAVAIGSARRDYSRGAAGDSHSLPLAGVVIWVAGWLSSKADAQFTPTVQTRQAVLLFPLIAAAVAKLRVLRASERLPTAPATHH